MKPVDVHAHLCDERFDSDRESVLERTKNELEFAICASSNISSSKDSVNLAKECDFVYCTVGVHPEDVENFDINEVEKLAKNKKVVAIGEIGLDYFYLKDLQPEEVEKQKKLQKNAFILQIDLANKLNLPIVVHSRDAMGDTLQILKEHTPTKESLLHCYSGSLESAQELIKLGFSFSFGGVTTFKNAKNVQEVVTNLPLQKIMLETDCPYLAPEPFRGTRNEPQNVKYVADKIAKLKNTSYEEVVKVTTQNAKRLFGI